MAERVQLYGHPLSQPSRSLIAFCAFSNIPFDLQVVDLAKQAHLTEEFSKINPFQSVPAIVHGDYNLWESGAIVAYLADSFNVDNQWYPKNPQVRGRVNAYLHFHHEGTRAQINQYFWPKFLFPKFFGGPELTPEAEVPLRAKLEEFFGTLKWLLSETGNVARTQEASIADIFAYNEISELKLINFDLSGHPEVKAWYDRIGAIPEVIASNETLVKTAAHFNPPA